MKLLTKTRRMTDFIQFTEASPTFSAAVDPERERDDASMVADDCDSATRESKLPNFVQVDSVQVNAGGHQTQVSVTEVTILYCY